MEDGEKGIHYSACESLKRSPSIGADRVNFRKGRSEVISRYVRSRIEDVVGNGMGLNSRDRSCLMQCLKQCSIALRGNIWNIDLIHHALFFENWIGTGRGALYLGSDMLLGEGLNCYGLHVSWRSLCV